MYLKILMKYDTDRTRDLTKLNRLNKKPTAQPTQRLTKSNNCSLQLLIVITISCLLNKINM